MKNVRFELKPIKKTGGMSFAILDGEEPAAFVYAPRDRIETGFSEVLAAVERLAADEVKPNAFVWVKAFSEPVKFRRRGRRVIILVGRRKGFDGQLEDFSVDFPVFLREVCAGIRYGLNLLLAGAVDSEMLGRLAGIAERYNRLAARTGQREYRHTAI